MEPMTSLFCRHNRFTADCPICSKGTVLDPARQGTRPRSTSASGGAGATTRRSGGGSRGSAGVAREFKGPYVTAGPYDSEDGLYEVRLERVPGGVRLASWARGALQRSAPVVEAADLPALVAEARERNLFPERDLAALEAALATRPGDTGPGTPPAHGTSPGRSGDLRDELRAEPLDEDRLRIARWIMRPNQGWELQEAPVMLPAKRYAEALRTAARAGLLPARDPD
jgi:hypothetical protein